MAPGDDRVHLVDAGGHGREVRLESYLDAAAIEAAESRANAWIKTLRGMRLDGVALRDRLTYRGDSLWWFVEIYLHKQRTIVSACRAIRALDTLAARERPQAIGPGPTALARLLVPQAAERHGIRLVRRGAGAAPALLGDRVRVLGRSRFHTLTALVDRARPGATPPRIDGPVEVAAFVHSAFWRQDRAEEGYVGPVLQSLEQRLGRDHLALVGLGPRTNFRKRNWRHRFAEFNDPHARTLPFAPIELLAGRDAIRPSLRVWRGRALTYRLLTASDEVRRASVIDGYDVWPALREDLLGVTHLQLPWSARAMDEAGAALDRLKPKVAVTYAEAGGWGRALALECRRRGIPLVGLQHGFIYRHWLNYLHEADEMSPSRGNSRDGGFPRPDLTLVYDGFARQHLLDAGHFAPESVVVTGSPRLEAFVAAGRRLGTEDRERIRAGVGARPNDKLLVLATKFTQIGSWFRALADAVAALGNAHLVVKCHPAETTEPYEHVVGTTPRVRIMGAGTDLADLVACADLIVTVNSTAAIEAMALDVPGLVVALPNNLSPFVEAGALAGVGQMAELGPALSRLLYDEGERQTLTACRRAFVERYGMVSQGGAADRAADAIVRLAGSREVSL